MIIELFGPPAAGKTTLARSLAAHLRSSGRPVELVLSVRPAEAPEARAEGPSAAPSWGLVRRLMAPAMELLAWAGRVRAGSRRGGLASRLLQLLPPSNPVTSLRLRQYIQRLESSWRLAERSAATVIFDQGFVQLICSLLLYVRSASPREIEQAVAAIPKADQWIHVEAPRELLQARLEARRRGQSWFERQCELDMETSLRSIEILKMLESILRRSDPGVGRVSPAATWEALKPGPIAPGAGTGRAD